MNWRHVALSTIALTATACGGDNDGGDWPDAAAEGASLYTQFVAFCEAIEGDRTDKPLGLELALDRCSGSMAETGATITIELRETFIVASLRGSGLQGADASFVGQSVGLACTVVSEDLVEGSSTEFYIVIQCSGEA